MERNDRGVACRLMGFKCYQSSPPSSMDEHSCLDMHKMTYLSSIAR